MHSDSASSGTAGIARLADAQQRGMPYDLVVIDMDMPGMDGMAVAREIKRHPGTAETPLVLLTSMGLHGDGGEARQCGFSAILTKPVRQSDLLVTLVNVLGVTSAAAAGPIAGQAAAGAPQELDLHILVAEDNLTNQEVVVGMLRKFGCRIDLAADGREALAAVGKRRYDLIFMDCQMPVMDGYAATAAIRRLERTDGAHRHTPIIALTAHALEGDRQKCLTAGMDDYMSKPFRPKEMRAMLERWGRRPSAADAPAVDGTGAADVVPETVDAIDRRVLYALKELQIDGEPDFLEQVVRTFLDSSVELMDRLRSSASRRDMDDMGFIAHRMKSSSANVGALQLSEYSRRLEMDCRHHAGSEAESLVSAIAEEFGAVRTVLEGELSSG